jgi:protein subunit release factor A
MIKTDNRLILTKQDFAVRWFSGTGKGGQYRNRHPNCCEITHIATGIKAQATGHRERIANQRDAFRTLARRIGPWIKTELGISDERDAVPTEVIRNYHGVRNVVKDHASGHCQPYADVVEKGDLSEMIGARWEAVVAVQS